MYVGDTVEAFRLLIKAPLGEIDGETFNFATASSVSVAEIAHMIAESPTSTQSRLSIRLGFEPRPHVR